MSNPWMIAPTEHHAEAIAYLVSCVVCQKCRRTTARMPHIPAVNTLCMLSCCRFRSHLSEHWSLQRSRIRIKMQPTHISLHCLRLRLAWSHLANLTAVGAAPMAQTLRLVLHPAGLGVFRRLLCA